MKKSILLFLWLIIACSSRAEDDEEFEPDYSGWLQVEVIIFDQYGYASDELPGTDLELDYPDNWLELGFPNRSDSAVEEIVDSGIGGDNGDDIFSRETADPDFPLSGETLEDESPDDRHTEKPYIPLDERERRLNPEAYAMNRTGSYKILFHEAWRQPVADPTQAPWILIRGGDRFGDHFELEGAIRLTRRHYRHLETNLWRSRFGGTEGGSVENRPVLPVYPGFGTEQPEPGNYSGETATSELPPEGVNSTIANSRDNFAMTQGSYYVESLVKLEQSHRVFLDRPRYFDHPQLGALILISKWPDK